MIIFFKPLVIIIVVAALISAIATCICLSICHRFFCDRQSTHYLNVEQADLSPYHYEFPKNQLKLGDKIGSGAFGNVIRGGALLSNGKITTVAVKILKENHDDKV